MKCCSSIKRNEILMHAASWMNSETTLGYMTEAVIEDLVLYDSIYIHNVPNRQIHRDRK